MNQYHVPVLLAVAWTSATGDYISFMRKALLTDAVSVLSRCLICFVSYNSSIIIYVALHGHHSMTVRIVNKFLRLLDFGPL